MTGCIDRNTGKITIVADDDGKKTAEVVRRLLSAARLVDTKGRDANE